MGLNAQQGMMNSDVTNGLLDAYVAADFCWFPFKTRRFFNKSLLIRRGSDDQTKVIGFDSNGNFNESDASIFANGATLFIERFFDPEGNDAVQTNKASQAIIYDGTFFSRLNGFIAPSFQSAEGYDFENPITLGTNWTTFLSYLKETTGVETPYGDNVGGSYLWDDNAYLYVGNAEGWARFYDANTDTLSNLTTAFQEVAGRANIKLNYNSIPQTLRATGGGIITSFIEKLGAYGQNRFKGNLSGLIFFTENVDRAAIETLINSKLLIY